MSVAPPLVNRTTQCRPLTPVVSAGKTRSFWSGSRPSRSVPSRAKRRPAKTPPYLPNAVEEECPPAWFFQSGPQGRSWEIHPQARSWDRLLCELGRNSVLQHCPRPGSGFTSRSRVFTTAKDHHRGHSSHGHHRQTNQHCGQQADAALPVGNQRVCKIMEDTNLNEIVQTADHVVYLNSQVDIFPAYRRYSGQ